MHFSPYAQLKKEVDMLNKMLPNGKKHKTTYLRFAKENKMYGHVRKYGDPNYTPDDIFYYYNRFARVTYTRRDNEVSYLSFVIKFLRFIQKLEVAKAEIANKMQDQF